MRSLSRMEEIKIVRTVASLFSRYRVLSKAQKMALMLIALTAVFVLLGLFLFVGAGLVKGTLALSTLLLFAATVTIGLWGAF
jgi:uncharacterized membrane protein